MWGLKLSGVEPLRIHTEGARWEQQRRRDQRQPREHKRNARERLLAEILPGIAPETCEFLVDLDHAGEPAGIAVRELATGRVLARLSNEQLGRLETPGGPGGLFFERKG